MADETAPTTGTEETNGQGTEGKEFTAITSQEDFDKAIQARIARERAKIPTDYDDLKTKAAKFAEWEEAQKTEAQKAQERLDAAEKRASELELKVTRAEVAAAKGVPANLLTGSTQEELEASADALIAFKGEPQPQRLHIPNEGGSPANTSTPSTEFAAFMNQQLGRTSA
jgi:DNA repair exonuclease SbcCD ATPase subunit